LILGSIPGLLRLSVKAMHAQASSQQEQFLLAMTLPPKCLSLRNNSLGIWHATN
jgi:hypothetical protein